MPQANHDAADFTLEGYRALLTELLGRGYRADTFLDHQPVPKRLLLRHDLDMSLQSATPVGEIEAALGLTATYFVLVRTEMYNPFSQRGLQAINCLRDLGHSIGLHFDASYYADDLDTLDEAVGRECAALEALLGQPVAMVSLHRPPARLQGLDRKLAGRHHTYEPEYFQDMGYCSDSRGGWHHGHPLEHPAIAQGGPLQLLTHPIWWHAGPDETVREKLDRLSLRRFDLLRAELARNCVSYVPDFRALDPETPG